LITGVKEDFVHEVTPVDPNCKIQGLNNLIIVEGIGLDWTGPLEIRDQLWQIAKIQTMAYFIPSATKRLSSPRLYFIQEQDGNLHMNKDGVMLQTAMQEFNWAFCSMNRITYRWRLPSQGRVTSAHLMSPKKRYIW
jgi:hypothetical protein